MSNETRKWNVPGYPWELEVITFCFFIIALLVPYYFHHHMVAQSPAVEATALEVGRSNLSTQFGMFWALAIVALYVFHLAIAVMDSGKITASPLHLLSPCAFALIAYYRISQTPGIENSALNVIDGSTLQAVGVVLVVGVITALLCRLRTYRYMLNFEAANWDMIKPARYDASYLRLIAQLDPLIYPPRRYLACNEGIVIEGWFYAMPISFSRIHSMSKIAGSGFLNTGDYYTSSTHHLIRMEMHDSVKATYISPDDRDEFIRYCVQHIARRMASHHASATRHGMLHASDTNHGTAGKGSKPGTRPGTRPGVSGKTNHGG